MIFESRDGSIEKLDRRTVVYYGVLTVCGTGTLKIPCRGRPWEVEVSFSDPCPPKPGCGPCDEDTVDIEIDHLIHPFPLWAVKISWEIKSGNIREITWKATVIRM